MIGRILLVGCACAGPRPFAICTLFVASTIEPKVDIPFSAWVVPPIGRYFDVCFVQKEWWNVLWIQQQRDVSGEMTE
jgi:hypothetical protein